MTKSASVLLLFFTVGGLLSSPTWGQGLSGRIQEVRDRLERDRYAGSAEHLGRLLYTDCEVRMEEAPIADAVAWLAGATGVPLRILDDITEEPAICRGDLESYMEEIFWRRCDGTGNKP